MNEHTPLNLIILWMGLEKHKVMANGVMLHISAPLPLVPGYGGKGGGNGK